METPSNSEHEMLLYNVPLNEQPSAAAATTTKSKKICRGCGESIKGKCVASKDGRLSGKWHRACFICHRCEAGFESGEFYVLDDYPYCQDCFHVENNSICSGCDTGIEGECVETSASTDDDDFTTSSNVVRYHSHCLTCFKCQTPIIDDEYFSVNGEVTCAAHAFILNDYEEVPVVENRRTRLLVV
jgi:hypothetical protein